MASSQMQKQPSLNKVKRLSSPKKCESVMKNFGLHLLCAYLRVAVDTSTLFPLVPLSYLRQLNPAFHLEKHPSPTPCGRTAAFIVLMREARSAAR